jgi:IPT/TIG domain
MPPNTNAGGGAFILTVNGSSFNPDAVVNFGGAHPTTAYMTGNQLTAMIPASAIAMPGSVPVTVTNPGHAGGDIYGPGGTTAETSAPMNFTVN